VIVPAPAPGGWGFHEVSRRFNDRALAAAAVVLVAGGTTLRVGTATATTPPSVTELPTWGTDEEIEIDGIGQLDSIDDELTRRALRASIHRAVRSARERAGADA
jgi:hypothetical protein